MLADQIVNEGLAEDLFENMPPVLASIKRATKYVLAPQFAAVADALSEDYTGLIRVFKFCRLPYREVWFEVGHLDRPQFAASDLQAPVLQSKPSRVGFLCRATRDDLSAWRTHLFWRVHNRMLDKAGNNAAGIAIDFDMTHPLTTYKETGGGVKSYEASMDEFSKQYIKFDKDHPGWASASESVKLMMLNHTAPAIPDYGVPRIPVEILSVQERQRFLNLYANLARSDWAGEAGYLLAVIGLLNARNAIETEAVSIAKLNKARQKRGDPPIMQHHLLKIAPRQEQRVARESHTGSGITMRGHFVSGHWKIRKTGIYFWRPFPRGDFKKGKVTKDYLVT